MKRPSIIYSIFDLIRFEKKHTAFHKLDLRTRLIVVACLIALAIFFNNVIFLSCLILASSTILIIAKEIKRWLKNSLMIWIVMVLIVLVNGLLTSIYNGVILALRFLAFILSISILTMTTNPDEVIAFLTILRSNKKIMASFMLSLRFTPIMVDEARKIMEAQEVRGWSFKKKSILKRLKPIIIPLLVRAFQMIHNVVVTMDIRAFNSKVNRTTSFDVKLTILDYAVITISIVVTICLLLII
ncbi:MAG: energy-coupling factor transporter transmembrane component T family protein [Candidatus Nezhaarchaeales archaeon]